MSEEEYLVYTDAGSHFISDKTTLLKKVDELEILSFELAHLEKN
jgi:hypothetical protein